MGVDWKQQDVNGKNLLHYYIETGYNWFVDNIVPFNYVPLSVLVKLVLLHGKLLKLPSYHNSTQNKQMFTVWEWFFMKSLLVVSHLRGVILWHYGKYNTVDW